MRYCHGKMEEGCFADFRRKKEKQKIVFCIGLKTVGALVQSRARFFLCCGGEKHPKSPVGGGGGRTMTFSAKQLFRFTSKIYIKKDGPGDAVPRRFDDLCRSGCVY